MKQTGPLIVGNPHHGFPVATLTARSMSVHVLKLFDPPPITIFDPWWRIPQTSSGGLGRSAANNCIASIGFGSAVAVGMFSSATHVSASCCFIGLRLGRGKATLATRLAFHPHRTTKG